MNSHKKMNKFVKQSIGLGLVIGTSALLFKMLKDKEKKETYVVSVNFDE